MAADEDSTESGVDFTELCLLFFDDARDADETVVELSWWILADEETDVEENLD